MEGDEGYNSDPTLGDKAHVLVSVVPVDTVALLSDEMVKKMKEVRMEARELGECTTMFSLLLYESKYQETISNTDQVSTSTGIPQLAILTRVDKACPEVQKDISNIHKSKYLMEKVHFGVFAQCHFSAYMSCLFIAVRLLININVVTLT